MGCFLSMLTKESSCGMVWDLEGRISCREPYGWEEGGVCMYERGVGGSRRDGFFEKVIVCLGMCI